MESGEGYKREHRNQIRTNRSSSVGCPLVQLDLSLDPQIGRSQLVVAMMELRNRWHEDNLGFSIW